ncbi:unnamed protein product, partial [Polarella glacialis]
HLLDRAWQEHPGTCLKLIFHMGARKGKQDRYGFYDAALWLHKRQPATLLANLERVPHVGCWKGLCEIVARICEGPRSHERDRALVYKYVLKQPWPTDDGGVRPWFQGSRLEQAAVALRRYYEDPVYRATHEAVAGIFTRQLQRDLRDMKAGKRLSLCAKWCPALGNSFDRRTLLCESIARRLFPASLPEYTGLLDSHYAFRVRDRLRREVLTPLKAYRCEPAVLISARKWGEIDYQRVPAECMRIYSETFKKKDGVRFEAYLAALGTGEAKATTGQRQPHQLLQDMQKGGPAAVVAEQQWKSLVQKLGTEDLAAVACCDVSYSMEAEVAPNVRGIDVAVALTVLLAELPGPFHGRAISFAAKPELKTVPIGSVPERASAVQEFAGDRTTDLSAVFSLLLESAKSGQNQSPRKVFIFSDMDFGAATGQKSDQFTTDLSRARELFEAAGVPLPEIVFWNIAGGTGSPALACTPGCVLVSGYSPVIMKRLLQAGKLDPLEVVDQAVSFRPYRQLHLVAGDVEALAAVRALLPPETRVVTRQSLALAQPGLPEAWAQPRKSPDVDLCFVMDCTGSMGGEIEAAKASVLKLADLIQSEVSRQTGLAPQVRLACVAFRDYCDDSERLQQIPFQSPSKEGHLLVREFIANQEASGGGDCPEDVFGGIDVALDFQWKAPLRFMLLVADAPCHGTMYQSHEARVDSVGRGHRLNYHDDGLGDDFPAGDPAGLTHDALMARMNAQDVSLLFLGIGKLAERMIRFFERCSHTGPITRMMLDRGCRDYEAAFQERIGAAIIGKITTALRGL